MFIESFKFRFINKQEYHEPYTHIAHNFSFRGKSGKRYIVVVEQYNYEIFCPKFYLAEHKSNIDKFSKKSKQFECSRVLTTVAEIVKTIYHSNPFGSFLIIGSNSNNEDKANSKRYKLYLKIMTQLISPVDFETNTLGKQSALLLLNRKHNWEIDDIKLEVENKLMEVFSEE
jgi:hypothetical protein